MSNLKKYQLQDLIERIERVDGMLKLHSANPSKFMLEQYEAKKVKLLGYLIDELVDSKIRSPYSFRLIVLALTKYYPQLTNENKDKIAKSKLLKSKNYKELKALEIVLAA
ncbi:hypothetical protein BH09BAC5_BH09BAC5_22240 [soil metagenome]